MFFKRKKKQKENLANTKDPEEKFSPPKPLNPEWVVGQYLTYVTNFENGDWDSISFYAQEQLDDIYFLILVGIRIPGLAFYMGVKIPTSKQNEGLDPFEITGVGEIYGTAPAEKKLMNYLARIMNLFELRHYTGDNKTLTGFNPAHPMGQFLRKISLKEDPWPEFNYIMTHEMSPEIPLTSVARSRIKESSFSLTLTSMGFNNPENNQYNIFTSTDFSEHRRENHPEFSLTYPATWILRHMPTEDGLPEIEKTYFTQIGGNSHAASVFVSLSESDDSEARYRELKERIQSDNSEEKETYKHRELQELNEFDGRAELLITDHSGEWISGTLLHGLFLSPDKKRFGSVSISVNYFNDNPLRELQGEIEVESVKIIKSFAFA